MKVKNGGEKSTNQSRLQKHVIVWYRKSEEPDSTVIKNKHPATIPLCISHQRQHITCLTIYHVFHISVYHISVYHIFVYHPLH